jgi:RimJ/RimL family protein N-acetyltransferase
MALLQTERLELREFAVDDAPLVLELVNDPLWIRFIGDRNVRSLDAARDYIAKLRRSYEENGFGLYLVERRSDREPLGMCGLVKRDTLPAPDIGFAFLERHRGEGYALEAARATLDYARAQLGLARVLAIATADNERSGNLLMKLGFVRQRSGDGNGNPDDPVEVWAS